MTTLALYAVSAALFAASPSEPAGTAPEDAQATTIPTEDSAVLQEGQEARTASAELPAPADVHGRAPTRADPAALDDTGFKQASDEYEFQQGTWTGP